MRETLIKQVNILNTSERIQLPVAGNYLLKGTITRALTSSDATIDITADDNYSSYSIIELELTAGTSNFVYIPIGYLASSCWLEVICQTGYQISFQIIKVD